MSRTPVILSVVLLSLSASAAAEAEPWAVAAAAGADYELNPKFQGHGFVLVDAFGEGVVGDANLRLHYNTETIHIEIERIPLGSNKVELSVAARGELIFAGILPDYYKEGVRVGGLGFNASYVQLIPKLQWHVANYQTLEVLLTVRRWFFGRRDSTAAAFALPADAWVFEPRLGYIYWHVTSDSDEWQAHRVFPRIVGDAFMVHLGVDVRSEATPWGIADGRNNPENAIWSIDESWRAGWQLGSVARLQIGQWAMWGWGQDDLTRARIGAMNPYVIPVPGLPWPALLSEKLFMQQLGLHLRPSKKAAHELGVYVAGGALNDVRRNGDLNKFGGTGGLSLFGDMRFGRVQLDVRLGWAFPVSWLIGGPYFSGIGTLGVRIL